MFQKRLVISNLAYRFFRDTEFFQQEENNVVCLVAYSVNLRDIVKCNYVEQRICNFFQEAIAYFQDICVARLRFFSKKWHYKYGSIRQDK